MLRVVELNLAVSPLGVVTVTVTFAPCLAKWHTAFDNHGRGLAGQIARLICRHADVQRRSVDHVRRCCAGGGVRRSIILMRDTGMGE